MEAIEGHLFSLWADISHFFGQYELNEGMLWIFLGTYAFTLITDLGRTTLEVFFNFFRRPGNPPRVKLETSECAIVIPCYNSDEVIKETLDTLPSGYKIYAVANGCTDRTMAILQECSTYLPNLEVINTAVPGKIRAVLLGALKARKDGYSHFMLLDDDIQWCMEADGSPQPITVYNKSKAVTALPVVPSKVDLNWIRSVQAVEYQMMCASKRAQGNLGNVIMASGAAGIYTLKTFIDSMQDHDGEHVGDDLQCSYIHHVKGYKIDFNSEAVVQTHPPVTLGSWWKQRAKRWEASPVFNLAWSAKIICAPLSKELSPGWWIRGVTFYRAFVIVNDLLRCYSLPFVLLFSPHLVLGVWAITYCSVLAKLVAFRYFFQQESYVKIDGITVASILTYPLYGAMMWMSRVYALPKGIALNWKYYGKGSRKVSTLASKMPELEGEIL